jgi:hypothetical protein
MRAPKGQYSLYYSLSSPFSSEETSSEEQFDDIVDALSTAFLVLHNGGNPTHLIYDNAVLFSGDDLKEVLKYISANGGEPGAALTEAVRKTLPEVLITELVKTVKVAHEHFGAVAVYRSMLEELYEAADQAIQEKDLQLLYKITGKLAFWYVPGESDVKQWGKDFLHAYRRDSGWLHDTKVALEKIKAAVKEFEAVDGSRNAELKAQILKAAEDGLITHI